MDKLAMTLGYLNLIFGGVVVTAVIAMGVTYLVNVSCHKALSSYGGWRVFKEFVAWRKSQIPPHDRQQRRG